MIALAFPFPTLPVENRQADLRTRFGPGAPGYCPRTADGPRPQRVARPRWSGTSRRIRPGDLLRTGTVRGPLERGRSPSAAGWPAGADCEKSVLLCLAMRCEAGRF